MRKEDVVPAPTIEVCGRECPASFGIFSCRPDNTLCGQIANANHHSSFLVGQTQLFGGEIVRDLFTLEMGCRFFTSLWQYDLPERTTTLQTGFFAVFCEGGHADCS